MLLLLLMLKDKFANQKKLEFGSMKSSTKLIKKKAIS